MNKSKIALLSALVITAIGSMLSYSQGIWHSRIPSVDTGGTVYTRIEDVLTVTWQYDGIREKFDQNKKQEEFAKEFSRTNTDPQRAVIIKGNNIRWQPEKGSKELGYRSDGVVVWRELPEGK